MNPKDFAFKVPFSVFVAGPSQSGKTRFTQQILKHIGKGILSKPIKKNCLCLFQMAASL